VMSPKRTSALASGICALAAAVLVTAGVSRVGGYTPALASNQTLTVTPQADSYVSAAAPTANYGSATTLTVGSSPVYHSYLLFSIAGLTGTVTSAELILHANTAGSGVALHQAQSTTWSESTITSGNAPTFGAVLNRDGQFNAGTWVTLAASPVVTGNGAYTMVLTSASAAPISLSSREAGSSLTPELVITESQPTPSPTPFPTKIQHVVIFFQENHSFDNVLGILCAENVRAMPCKGATSGVLPDGSTIPLSQPPDIVPNGAYNPTAQAIAMDGGKMDGWPGLGTCRPPSYPCYSAYRPSQIPNEAALATKFAVSDMTFELNPVPSWPGHMELAAGTLDGFLGFNPTYNTNQSPPPPAQGPGWGCDSNRDSPWSSSGTGTGTLVPSCIPDPSLDPARYPNAGAYRATPVQHVDTIMDRLDSAGLSWKLYDNNYIWAICPTFADCLDTSQRTNMVPTNQFLTDAQDGTLPNLSILLPSGGVTGQTSQHNGTSMANGDNWIGQAMTALEKGPDWLSTAVFITYDDMGGFYDQVPPPFAGAGVRVPMVIVSPYAKPGFTDSMPATYASMLAYVEHVFTVSPLGSADRTAYDYSNSFDYAQAPLSGAVMTRQSISKAEQQYLKVHPPNPNETT
jgi:Phosphoesterase family